MVQLVMEPHTYWLIGRSLIRTFMAGAAKDAAICLVSEGQLRDEKVEDCLHTTYFFSIFVPKFM